MDLRQKLIKLAHDNPQMRRHILPLLKEAKVNVDHDCMKKHKNPDGSFKGGFDGCVKAFEDCATGVTDAAGLCAHIGRATGKIKGANTEESYRYLVKQAHERPELRNHLLPIIKKCAVRKQAQQRNVPKKVQELAAEIRKNMPEYDDSKAYATAWSIFCKYIEPGSPHCHKPIGEYFPGV